MMNQNKTLMDFTEIQEDYLDKELLNSIF